MFGNYHPKEEESSTEEATESKFASVAEDVRTMVKGANLLREGVREGEVVKDVLLEPPATAEQAEETDKKSENKKKLSHFQAMALMGKLFFGLKTKTIEEEAEEDEEETSYEEEGEESEEEEEEEATEFTLKLHTNFLGGF